MELTLDRGDQLIGFAAAGDRAFQRCRLRVDHEQRLVALEHRPATGPGAERGVDRDKPGLVNLELDILFEQLAEGFATDQINRIFRLKQRLATGHGSRHHQPPGAGQILLVNLMNIDHGLIAPGDHVMARSDDQNLRLCRLTEQRRVRLELAQ